MSTLTRKQMRELVTSHTMRNILESGRMPMIMNMGRERLEQLQAWYDANPEAENAYSFYDGRIIEESKYAKTMTSRTAQLVAIITDGFPALTSRWSVKYCLAPETECMTIADCICEGEVNAND